MYFSCIYSRPTVKCCMFKRLRVTPFNFSSWAAICFNKRIYYLLFTVPQCILLLCGLIVMLHPRKTENCLQKKYKY